VRPEWIDYNGHMTDSRYLQVFGDATDALLRYAGIDDAYRSSGRALYTVETHVVHKAEARALEALYVTTRVLETDDKRVRLLHALHRQRDEGLEESGSGVSIMRRREFLEMTAAGAVAGMTTPPIATAALLCLANVAPI